MNYEGLNYQVKAFSTTVFLGIIKNQLEFIFKFLISEDNKHELETFRLLHLKTECI